MKIFIISTMVFLSVVSYATYESSSVRIASTERIADLLIKCDMVVVSKSKSFWLQNKENIGSASFEVQAVLGSKVPEEITRKFLQDNSFTLVRNKRSKKNDFPVYEGVQYILFIKLPDDAKVEDQDVGELRVLEYGSFRLTELQNVPGLKERFNDDEKLTEFINLDKTHYKNIYGVEGKSSFEEVLKKLIYIMTVNNKFDAEPIENDLYKSNLEYLLQYGPYKKFIDIGP